MALLLVAILLSVILYQGHTADICGAEFDGALSCLKTGVESNLREINLTALEDIGHRIQSCFEVHNCTAPIFEQNITDHIPEEYRAAAELFIETCENFPAKFHRCVLKKSRTAILAGIQECVQNTTESLKEFEYPELDLPEGYTDDEKEEAHAFFAAHVNAVVSLQKCHAEKGNETLIRVDQCIKDVTKERQLHVCNVKQSCRANVTDSDNRTCSSRMDQVCAATVHCLEEKKAETKGFFDHIIETFKVAAEKGPSGAKSLVGPLSDFVTSCEKETKYKIPKGAVLKIFSKLPKKPLPQEVIEFVKIFADIQQEDQINPCDTCQNDLPSSNITLVNLAAKLENSANITAVETTANVTIAANTTVAAEEVEATTKASKKNKPKHTKKED